MPSVCAKPKTSACMSDKLEVIDHFCVGLSKDIPEVAPVSLTDGGIDLDLMPLYRGKT